MLKKCSCTKSMLCCTTNIYSLLLYNRSRDFPSANNHVTDRASFSFILSQSPFSAPRHLGYKMLYCAPVVPVPNLLCTVHRVTLVTKVCGWHVARKLLPFHKLQKRSLSLLNVPISRACMLALAALVGHWNVYHGVLNLPPLRRFWVSNITNFRNRIFKNLFLKLLLK